MFNFWTQLANNLTNSLNGNVVGAKIALVFIFIAFLLVIPVGISILFPIFKSKLNHRTKVYLYAFSTGFFLILASFGFLREALHNSEAYAESHPEVNEILINVLVVFGGLISGLMFSFALKYVITYRINKKLMSSKKLSVFVHDHSHEHGVAHIHEHPDHIFTQEDSLSLAEDALAEKVSGKLKVIALALLLTHRVPEGFLIGYNLSLFFENGSGSGAINSLTTAYFISLILHMIPEELVYYYRLREAGYGRWSALLISTLMDFLFLPFMIVGVFVGGAVANHIWAQGFMMAIIGGIFLFTSLVEFFPEFYHVNMEKKQWFITIISLFVGVAFAAFVLLFHSHGSHEMHAH
ncbi:ZIP family metal transporter [Mycoplasma corogypsi]|uniref:ZIP family metal transporter n=1 Tax=Mycoplasma corogypsi TaxID=2106 RepID=UPI003872C793